MARLHQIVVAAAETTNLEELAAYLVEACRIVIASDNMPHRNFAVRFLCFQIAFAGDGDIEIKSYYKSILDFSQDNVDINEPEGEPSEPSRTSS